MSWYALGKLPAKVRDSITAQDWKFGDSEGWYCGCLAGKDDDGTPLVWLCKYHEGAYDFCEEEGR